MALPKANRLKDKKDFDRVFKKGSAVKGSFLFIRAVKSGSSKTRFGFIVPAKVIKGAVARNRIKRLFSDIIQRNKNNWQKGLDTIIGLNKKGKDIEIALELYKLLSLK